MNIDAIICDMDGTLVNYANEPFHSSWDALAAAFPDNKKRRWYETRDFYYPRQELFREWFEKQVELLKGLSVMKISEHLFPLPYSEGVVDFFKNQNGFGRGILSAGVSLVADRIIEELKFDFVVVNYLEVRKGFLTGKGELKANFWRKDLDLLEIAGQRGLDLNRILYVGDNENDIPVFEIVGFPVAFKPKTEKTRRAAKYVIDNFSELTKILSLVR